MLKKDLSPPLLNAERYVKVIWNVRSNSFDYILNCTSTCGQGPKSQRAFSNIGDDSKQMVCSNFKTDGFAFFMSVNFSQVMSVLTKFTRISRSLERFGSG